MFKVVIPVLNQHDTTRRMIQSWFDTAKGYVEIVFIDNGSDSPLTEQKFFQDWQYEYGVKCIRNEKNTGVFPTFQQGYDLLKDQTDFIFFSHNDVQMVELGWDDKLVSQLYYLKAGHKPGVCGMFGAKGIGTPQIYKAPYHFTQLMRWDCVTVESMMHGGSRLVSGNRERVMVLDGFSLIVSTHMVKYAMGGVFDHMSYPAHHCYDLDICLMSHFGGFENYVLDIDCIHHGGVTSTREKWAEAMGTSDLAIHRKAHEVMYRKYMNRLPVSVK